MRKLQALLVTATLLIACRIPAAEFFIAPDGNDEAAGTRTAPFATIQRAQRAVAPGDTVFIRGGTYRMAADRIAREERIFAYVTLLDRSGEPGRPISYRAAPGENPVFDFTNVRPQGRRVHAFRVTGSWLHLEGFEVVGVQVTITGHTQSIGFDNQGSHNLYERLSVHDGMAIGFWIGNGSHNLVLNCDAFRNHDNVSEN
ncbi:MAG: right-handed parallel beta-helix repeat-containing protein, partial [Opitutaceae bacterium]